MFVASSGLASDMSQREFDQGSGHVGMITSPTFLDVLDCGGEVPLSMERYAFIHNDPSTDSITMCIQGPYFVAFPNLNEARANNIPIQTRARSCTILPTFVG